MTNSNNKDRDDSLADAIASIAVIMILVVAVGYLLTSV